MPACHVAGADVAAEEWVAAPPWRHPGIASCGCWAAFPDAALGRRPRGRRERGTTWRCPPACISQSEATTSGARLNARARHAVDHHAGVARRSSRRGRVVVALAAAAALVVVVVGRRRLLDGHEGLPTTDDRVPGPVPACVEVNTSTPRARRAASPHEAISRMSLFCGPWTDVPGEGDGENEGTRLQIRSGPDYRCRMLTETPSITPLGSARSGLHRLGNIEVVANSTTGLHDDRDGRVRLVEGRLEREARTTRFCSSSRCRT